MVQSLIFFIFNMCFKYSQTLSLHFFFFYFERDRDSVSGGGAERERDRERIPSRLWDGSTEPDSGLKPMKR